jgi:hypothetical protein
MSLPAAMSAAQPSALLGWTRDADAQSAFLDHIASLSLSTAPVPGFIIARERVSPFMAALRGTTTHLTAAVPMVHTLTHLAPDAAAAFTAVAAAAAAAAATTTPELDARFAWLSACAAITPPPPAAAAGDVAACTQWLSLFRCALLSSSAAAGPVQALLPSAVAERARYCPAFPPFVSEERQSVHPVDMNPWAAKLLDGDLNNGSDNDGDGDDSDDDNTAAAAEAAVDAPPGAEDLDVDDGVEMGAGAGSSTSKRRCLASVCVFTRRNLALAAQVRFLPGHAFAATDRFDSTIPTAAPDAAAAAAAAAAVAHASPQLPQSADILRLALAALPAVSSSSSAAAAAAAADHAPDAGVPTAAAAAAARVPGAQTTVLPMPLLPRRFSFIELFSGVGGFRLGLQALGGVCVAACEIAPHARAAYALAHRPGAALEGTIAAIAARTSAPLASVNIGTVADGVSSLVSAAVGAGAGAGAGAASPLPATVVEVARTPLAAAKAAARAAIDARCAVAAALGAAAPAATPVPVPALLFDDVTALPGAWIPPHTVLTAGFPCQPFSRLGAQPGLADPVKGGLFMHVARIAAECKPPLLILENVPGLVTIDNCKVRFFSNLRPRVTHVLIALLRCVSHVLPFLFF